MTIQQGQGSFLLKNDIRMMSDVKTEKTGFMDPAVLMMVKDRDKESETDCNQ